jgi:hypothetical protein
MKRTALATMTALAASLLATPGSAQADPVPECQLGAIPLSAALQFRISNGEQVRAGLNAGNLMASLFGLQTDTRLGSGYVLRLNVHRGDDNDQFGQIVSQVEFTDGLPVELAPIYNFGSTVENYYVTGEIFRAGNGGSDLGCSSVLQIPEVPDQALADIAVVPDCRSRTPLGISLPGPFTVGTPYAHTFTSATVGTQEREADIVEVGFTTLDLPQLVGVGSQVTFTPPSTSFNVRARTFEGSFWEVRTCTGPTETISVTAASAARVAAQKPVTKKSTTKKPRAAKSKK